MKPALTMPHGSPWVVNLVLLKWVKGGSCFGGGNPTHYSWGSSGGHLGFIWGDLGISDGQLEFIW
eukprot:7054540-Karenia_brevis.AAC.1